MNIYFITDNNYYKFKINNPISLEVSTSYL